MIVAVYYMPDPGTGGKPEPKKSSAPVAPEGYTPLTVPQRTQWNNFLDYLEQQKVGGNAVLDKRDQSLGMAYMQKYKAMNPDFSITPQDIPRIQYEQYLLRKGDSFPTMTKEGLNYIRGGLNEAYMARDVSPQDGWLGSITSRLYYPRAYRSDNQGNKYDFGTAIEDYFNAKASPSIQDKYLMKPNKTAATKN